LAIWPTPDKLSAMRCRQSDRSVTAKPEVFRRVADAVFMVGRDFVKPSASYCKLANRSAEKEHDVPLSPPRLLRNSNAGKFFSVATYASSTNCLPSLTACCPNRDSTACSTPRPRTRQLNKNVSTL